MITKYFKCTFIDDIVLHSSSNTEGKTEILDYIPGSNFLGIVAKEYPKYEENGTAFEIFHSGKVRFGDAHRLYNEKRTYKIPFSYYTQKGYSSKEAFGLKIIKMYNQDTERDEIKNLEQQYRQLRDGYMTNSGTYVNTMDFFRQKSARDFEKRKSDDGKMFGYRALQKDTKWVFFVEFDDMDVNNIKNVYDDLVGEKSIGKSKSAEYGRVNIEFYDSEMVQMEDVKNGENDEIFLYADSALILQNEYGMPTFEPTVENLRLPQGSKIIFEKSQIRTRTYSPWNAKRKIRDYERAVIEKGSVIVVDISGVSNFDLSIYKNKIEKGIGAFKSEGFGKILVNPEFLYQNEFGYESETRAKPRLDNELDLIKYLKNSKKQKFDLLKIAKDVQRFILIHKNIYEGLSPTQWGRIREIVEDTDDETNLYDAIKNQISTGEAGKKWNGDRADKLLNEIKNYNRDKRKFVALLATEMQRNTKRGQHG